jgi:hypothetical protein
VKTFGEAPKPDSAAPIGGGSLVVASPTASFWPVVSEGLAGERVA